MERVIGYKLVEKDIIVSRPVEWGSRFGNFRELKPITIKKKVLSPIYENLGSFREDQNMITQWEEGTRLGK